MSLKPWEEGYEAPPLISNEEYAEHRYSNGAHALEKGRAKRMERKEARDAGLPVPKSKEEEIGETRTEETLTEGTKNKVKEFVMEYLRDFNGTAAVMRCGWNPQTAHTTARKYLHMKYTQDLINEVMAEVEEDQLINRKQIIAGLVREANYFGEDGGASSRIKALMGLARIKKMDVQVQEVKGVIQHNVMAVPMAVDTDAWAAAAEQSQAELKSDVRT